MHQTCKASTGKSGAVDRATALGYESTVDVDRTGQWISELEADLESLNMGGVGSVARPVERRHSFT